MSKIVKYCVAAALTGAVAFNVWAVNKMSKAAENIPVTELTEVLEAKNEASELNDFETVENISLALTADNANFTHEGITPCVFRLDSVSYYFELPENAEDVIVNTLDNLVVFTIDGTGYTVFATNNYIGANSPMEIQQTDALMYVVNVSDSNAICVVKSAGEDDADNEVALALLNSIKKIGENTSYTVIVNDTIYFDGLTVNYLTENAVILDNGVILSEDSLSYKDSLYDESVTNTNGLEFAYNEYDDSDYNGYNSYVYNADSTALRFTTTDVSNLDVFHSVNDAVIEETTELTEAEG